MKRNPLLFVTIVSLLVLSACGSSEPAEPTLSAESLAGTAVAAAWVAVTQTQAALPTPTPAPPTPEPIQIVTTAPTLQLLATLPPATIAVAATPTAQCDQIPVEKPKGALVTVEFTNEALGGANFAFGMFAPNAQGECFTYSFSIGRGDAISQKVLAGCYWGYAWITGEESSVAKSGDTVLCVTDTAVVYHVKITKESVVFK